MRKVEGFMSNNGHFFESESECMTYEAMRDIQRKINTEGLFEAVKKINDAFEIRRKNG